MDKGLANSICLVLQSEQEEKIFQNLVFTVNRFIADKQTGKIEINFVEGNVRVINRMVSDRIK